VAVSVRALTVGPLGRAVQPILGGLQPSCNRTQHHREALRGVHESTGVVGSDEMKHEVGHEVGRDRDDDCDSDQPRPASSRSTTLAVRFGGLALVVLIARLRRQLSPISRRPIAD
jgi:hypothetical protein